MLTAALGVDGERKEMPKGAAGSVQGRASEVPKTHSSWGPGDQRAHNTRSKLIWVQNPACPQGSEGPRANQFLPEP